MGATTFETYGLGKTPQEAFNAAQQHDQYMYGHGGYTGTLAEKHGFVLFKLPPRCTVDKVLKLIDEMSEFNSLDYLRQDLQYARNKTDLRQREANIRKEEKLQASFWRKHAALKTLLKEAYPIYDDKWGPAVAFEITGTQASAIKKTRGRAGTHDRVFVFCGWASC